MTRQLSDFDVLTFDCYGTLIDWESGIWDALQPLLMHNDCAHLNRQTVLKAFARLETAQQRQTPGMLYPEVLRSVHKAIANHLELRTNQTLDDGFGLSVSHWPAFPDTADALRILKRHYRLVILSNVNRDGFAASACKLGVQFDAVYTAEDIGSYKPAPGNFEYLLKQLPVDKSTILHTAQSLHHDLVPAAKVGLAKAWIDRQDLANSNDWGATAVVDNRPECEFRFTTLMEMAQAIQ